MSYAEVITLRSSVQAAIDLLNSIGGVDPCPDCVRGGGGTLYSSKDDAAVDAALDVLEEVLELGHPPTSGGMLGVMSDPYRGRPEGVNVAGRLAANA